MRNDEDRILDIQEAILKIEKYSVQGKVEFLSNELIQSWVLLQLQIIGEAVRSTSKETQKNILKSLGKILLIFAIYMFMNILEWT